MSDDGSITICYCENPDCHKIYPGSITRDMDLKERPKLPCGHRISNLVMSSMSLRQDNEASTFEKQRNYLAHNLARICRNYMFGDCAFTECPLNPHCSEVTPHDWIEASEKAVEASK